MSTNVESMFYVRETPWHGLGIRLNEAPDSEKALIAAGLAWGVRQTPIYITVPGEVPGMDQFMQIPDMVANVRSTDNKSLGIVSRWYQVVQNREAFAFTDQLLGEGVVYETAGSLNGGRRVWMLAKLPERYKALGDDIEPYVCFSNSHDGSSAVRVILTPVRVVCQNTLNLALNGAKRIWSAQHSSNIFERMNEARRTLDLAHRYYETFTVEAEKLADIKVDFEQFTEKLFPISNEATPTTAKNVERRRQDLMTLLQADDVTQFRGTGWGFLNGVSDMVSHGQPSRVMEGWKERRLAKAFDGFELLNKAQELVYAKVA